MSIHQFGKFGKLEKLKLESNNLFSNNYIFTLFQMLRMVVASVYQGCQIYLQGPC